MFNLLRLTPTGSLHPVSKQPTRKTLYWAKEEPMEASLKVLRTWEEMIRIGKQHSCFLHMHPNSFPMQVFCLILLHSVTVTVKLISPPSTIFTK